MLGHCDCCEKYKEITVDPDYPQFYYCASCYMHILTEMFNQM